jgi:hypothetical protein
MSISTALTRGFLALLQNFYDPTADQLYRGYLTATIVGVVGGFIGIGILVWQAVLTRRSANAAKDAADAVMNSERAWLIVDLSWKDGRRQGIIGESISFGVQTWSVFVVVTSRNFGRTPAWITERRIGVLSSREPIPQNPPLGNAKVLASTSDTILVGEPGYSTEEGVASSERIADESGRVIYGVVKYRDIYGKERETTFGYRVTKNYYLERLSGFPQYNKHG